MLLNYLGNEIDLKSLFSDPSFYSLVDQCWNGPSIPFLADLEKFPTGVKVWNKKSFETCSIGNRNILARLVAFPT